MPDPAPGSFIYEFDTGDFDPVEEREIEEALADTPEGNRKFKHLVLTEQIKRRKFCKRATGNFHHRTTELERRVFAWKYQVAGMLIIGAPLLSVIAYLLVKVLKW
jgi:hypothetical protein